MPIQKINPDSHNYSFDISKRKSDKATVAFIDSTKNNQTKIYLGFMGNATKAFNIILEEKKAHAVVTIPEGATHLYIINYGAEKINVSWG